MNTDLPTFVSFRDKALKNPDVKATYEDLAPDYAMKRAMIARALPDILLR